MGKYVSVAWKTFRQATIETLGGYNEDQMREVLALSNKLADLAKKGKYAGAVEALRVAGGTFALRKLTARLWPEFAEKAGYFYFRRKRSIRPVEIVHRSEHRTTSTIPCEIVNETRACRLLEQNSRPSE